MVEWLAVWGVTQAVGFLFKSILEDLAKDAAKDWAKDLFKGALTNVMKLPSASEQRKAAGQAVKEFLQLVQLELEYAGLTDDEVKSYTKALKRFIKDKTVTPILGAPFQPDYTSLDTPGLLDAWQALDLPNLPDDFGWDRVCMLYIKKVVAIRQESEELRKAFDSENLKKIADDVEKIVGVTPDFDLAKYREGLLKRYGNLNMESLDTTGSAYNAVRLWRMFIPQTVRECQEFMPQVYEIPKEAQQRLRETGEVEDDLVKEEVERYRKAYYEQPNQSVLETIDEHRNPYLVILGDPGSGKSTLLQYLALEWTRKPLRDLSAHPLPLLIELRTYSRDVDNGVCNDFIGFCNSGNIVCRLDQIALNERLKSGAVIAMFDGLDEIFDRVKRDAAITAIHRFTNDYPKVRAIVTSRVIGYKAQRFRDAEFRHFMLQDLDMEQVDDFIFRWHDLTYRDPSERIRIRDRLKKAVSDSSAIRELAGNPLLLTMMAILNRNQELPRDRAELYSQSSRVLLHQWDIERTLVDEKLESNTIDYKDKQAMLRAVAYYMQTNEKGLTDNLIHAEDLERILHNYLKTIDIPDARIVSRVMIEKLRTRNFILCYVGAEYYAFVHRTFLEYFCAWEFVMRFNRRGAPDGITIENLKTDVFGKRWPDESWHEVLRLIAGIIDPPFVAEIVEHLMEVDGKEENYNNLFLSADCIEEVRNRNAISVIGEQLRNRLEGLVEYDEKDVYEPGSIYTLFISDFFTKVISTIASKWKEDSKTLLWLKTCAKKNDKLYVRKAAMKEIANNWKDEPETFPWLKSRLQEDENFHIREVIVQELARGWKDDPNTFTWLKSIVQGDDYETVRKAAVQELARGWRDTSDTLSIIKNLVRKDDHTKVRYVAVQELARGWKDDPATLPIIKILAQEDDEYSIRQVALQELARGWKDDPDTLPIIKIRTNDDHWSVRQAAVQELARGWKDDQATLHIIITCAHEDNIGTVRKSAVQELARGWKNEPWMFNFLFDRAVNDPFEGRRGEGSNPRLTALQNVAKLHFDHALTFALLNDRTINDPDKRVRELAKRLLERKRHLTK